jgi:hypothetical protein
MNDLLIPRRLAIALLAEAQRAPGGRACGLIGAEQGRPMAAYPAAGVDAQRQALEELRGKGQTLWAVFRTEGAEPGWNFEVPELVITLDTKGVLQLRCPPSAGEGGVERVVRIAEP